MTDMQPKVSVVIPIWNTEKYLERCLESVVNQTLKDIEIICVNNGSTDSSSEIIEKFAKNDDRIKVVTIEHGCLSNARNAGMMVATAPYMTFVDSDDWIEERNYECALAEFEKDSSIDIVCWGANIINTDLPENSTYIKSARNYHRIKTTGKQKITDNLILNNTVCVWNKMFKTDIIKNNDVLYPVGHELEDNTFYHMYMANSKNAFYINEYFYNYVQHKNSGLERIRSGKSSSYAIMMKNFEFLYKYFKEHGFLDAKSDLIKNIFKRWLYADYRDAREDNKDKVLLKASQLAKLVDFKKEEDGIMFEYLKKKNFPVFKELMKNSFAKLWGNKILGLYYKKSNNKKVLIILGLKITFNS